MTGSAKAEGAAPSRNPRRPGHRRGWAGIGPLHSLRAALMMVTAVAIAPMMLFASAMAILRAHETQRLPTAAAWLTVSALPLLIGVAAILIVALAWEALVIRWLSYLERLSRAYARGRYSLRPRRLHEAPYEFRALGQAVEEMAAAVEHRDQALREALDEQTVLLREVHHRVKNNMQIVGSLLSLQAQRSDDPAAREALLDALVRLDAIALGQRFMQEQEEEEQVSSTELFEAFVRQSRARLGSGRRSLEVVGEIEPRLMPLEVGSRLVLLAAEALLDAYHASSGPLSFHLALRFEDRSVVLALSAPLQPGAIPAGVSHDLIQGYVRQLRARLEVAQGSGAMLIRVPLPPPAPAAANDTARASSAQGPKFFRILDRTERGVAS
jgi:HAMP domain-containing protein